MRTHGRPESREEGKALAMASPKEEGEGWKGAREQKGERRRVRERGQREG